MVLFVVIFLLAGCETFMFSAKPGTRFTRQSSITVVGEDDDSGTVGELNYLLLQKGFNVISYSTAKHATKYNDRVSGSNSINSMSDAEIYAVKELNSMYALELTYTYELNTLLGAFYNSFSARVVDLETGEVIVTASSRGDTVRSVLRNFVNQLSQHVE